MPHRRFVRSLLLVCLISLIATSLFAPTITGRVTRADGAGISGVIVQVVGIDRAALTDSAGNFVVDAPPGTYTLQFSAGDQVATQENVVVGRTPVQVDKQVDWRLSVAE